MASLSKNETIALALASAVIQAGNTREQSDSKGPEPIGKNAIEALEIYQEIRDGLDNPGSGLETGLTKLVALSWQHGGTVMLQVRIDAKYMAIVVGFGKEKLGDAGRIRVAPGSLDEQTFQLFVQKQHHETNYDWYDYMRIAPLEIVPVSPVINAAGLIVSATRVNTVSASGAAFLLSTEAFRAVWGQRLLVVLKGDFILDETGDRAIDAEFVRAELPTGHSPKGGLYGIQGGRFESWFVADNKIDLNTATLDEIRFIPRVGPALAASIVKYRTAAGGFNSVDDLLNVPGLGQDLLNQIKPFIVAYR